MRLFLFVLFKKNLSFLLILIFTSVHSFCQEVPTINDQKIEKRIVDPKSILIGAGANFIFASNSVSSGTNKFTSIYGPAMHSQFNIQIGIGKNYFIESNISFEKHWITFNDQQSARRFIFLQDVKMLKLQAGLAYRITNPKSHFNFCTVSGGFGLGFVTNKGINGSYYGITYSSNGYFEDSGTLTLNHSVVPAIYLSLSKDLKLTQNLMLSVGYRFDLGLINYFTANEYYRFGVTDSFTTALITSKGTVHSATLLLKYCLLTKKK